jgi:AcrR family transcriptional regulator
MGELRESKKRETRQRISNVATKLFIARGFDAVTLDEIAVASNVSKMTVFNYFARKEDLMLDREDDLRLQPFRDAIRERPKGQSPIDALRVVVNALTERKLPFSRIESQTLDWWKTVVGSTSLTARMRELLDEAAEGLAVELGGAKPDGTARLMAGLIVLTVRTAREEALRALERGSSAKKANAAFMDLMERGLSAVDALAEQ